MQIGIYTRYHHCEATYAAIRIAETATQLGWEVSFLATNQKPCRVHSAWDPLVQYLSPRAFSQWAKECDVLIWTHCPPSPQVMWANRQDKKTVILALWHELFSKHRKALREAQTVVYPCHGSFGVIQPVWQLNNGVTVPWDTGLPITAKHGLSHPERMRLLLPLYDHTPHQTDESLLDVLTTLLARMPQVDLTVAYTTSTIAPTAARRLRRLSQAYPGRVTLRTQVPLVQRPLIYGKHDLTVWPTRAEDLGLVGLSSLAMGTPVLAFSVAPITEFMNSRNAVLIPTRVQLNALGVPTAVPDYRRMGHYLQELVVQRARLAQMNGEVALSSRRLVFDQLWQDVLGTPD